MAADPLDRRDASLAEAAEQAAQPLVSHDRLRKFIFRAGEVAGLDGADLELFVDGVAEADLRDLASHGVFRTPFYVRGFQRGELKVRPEIRELKAFGVTRHLDGDSGLGVILGQRCMDIAIELAESNGIGLVAMRNSNHTGVLAVHVMRAAQRGMIGYFVSNAPALMAPWGGVEPILSNSPFAYAVPTLGDPIILDMACSASARGKIRLAAKEGRTIPLGWAVDSSGHPTEDAHAALNGLILPMAGYKGYGIALVNELLAAVLPGAVLAVDVSRQFLREDATYLDAWGIGHLAMAINPDAFVGRDSFAQVSQSLVDRIKSSGRAEGQDRILVPGEPEAEARTKRIRDGVPISPAVAKLLRQFAAEAGIEPLL
jgi:LDH2 family malate/lactate/ureidoglycolate dehydrogenase